MKAFLQKKSSSIKFYLSILSFGLLYAVLVWGGTAIFKTSPGAIKLEQSLYDRVQKKLVIDQKDDCEYNKYASKLEQLTFINFDSSVIDSETDRLIPDSLAAFLEKVALLEEGDTFQLDVLYINYRVRDLTENSRNRLCTAMKPFGKRLLLPYVFNLKDSLYLNYDDSGIKETRIDSQSLELPMCSGSSLGYVQKIQHSISEDFRLYKYRRDDNEHYSIAYKLYELASIKEQEKNRIENVNNSITTINFLLRNKSKDTTKLAISHYQLSELISDTISEEEIKELLTGKIVCLGLFDEYLTKYGHDIQKYATPVDAKMPNILLDINAYLNLETNSVYKQGSYWYLFLFNFIIGSIFSFFYNTNYSFLKRTVFVFIFNLIVSFGFSYLFVYLSIITYKLFPFGITYFFTFQIIYIYLIYNQILSKMGFNPNNKTQLT